MSSKPEPWISPEQYLEAERRAETKSEYLDGRVFPMTGASRKHNVIVVNLVTGLNQQLRGRPSEVYACDMRVRVPDTRLYAYPDISVVGDAPQFEDARVDTLLNPTMLVEVLSDSTERWDRHWKAHHYRRIPSLQEYLFLLQDSPLIERYRRHGERDWLLTEVAGLDETVELASIECTIALREVYERVL